MKFNKLVPELTVSDFEKSLKFYATILGFKVEYSRDNPKFAFLSLGGAQIMIEQKHHATHEWSTAQLEHPFGRGINFQIEVKNLNLPVKKLQKENHPLKMKPQVNWYKKGTQLLGCKEILVQDPDGYLLRFSQNAGTKKAPLAKQKSNL